MKTNEEDKNNELKEIDKEGNKGTSEQAKEKVMKAGRKVIKDEKY